MAQALEDFDQADRIAAANVTLNPYNIPEDENIVVPQIEPTTTNYDTLFGKIDTIPNISNLTRFSVIISISFFTASKYF